MYIKRKDVKCVQKFKPTAFRRYSRIYNFNVYQVIFQFWLSCRDIWRKLVLCCDTSIKRALLLTICIPNFVSTALFIDKIFEKDFF